MQINECGKLYNCKYPGLLISTKGYVYDSVNEKWIEPTRYKDEDVVISYNGEVISLARLVMETFVGELDAKIKYYDGNHRNCSTRNLSYKLKVTELSDPKRFMINGKIFKNIPGFDTYFISEDGITYSTYYHKLMIKGFNHGGYETVALVDNAGKRTPKKVHRMVYLTYIGELASNLTIDHLDGNKHNNHWSNLEQVSTQENIHRSYEMGLGYKRWSDEQIHQICKMLEDATPTVQIVNNLGLDPSVKRDMTFLIHNLYYKKLYKNISDRYNLQKRSYLNKKNRKITDQEAISIKREIAEMKSDGEISRIHNCNRSIIYAIRHGKTWKDV